MGRSSGYSKSSSYKRSSASRGPRRRSRSRSRSPNGFSEKRSRRHEDGSSRRLHKSSSTRRHHGSVNVFDHEQAQTTSTASLSVESGPSATAADRLQRLQAWRSQSTSAVSGVTSVSSISSSSPPETPGSNPQEPQPTLDERSKDESLGIDPLDAFMQTLMEPEERTNQKSSVKSSERIFGAQEVFSEDEFDGLGGGGSGDEQHSWMKQREKKFKKKEIKAVDHSLQKYPPFRKDFYVESPDIAEMSEEEVIRYRREELEGVVIRGRDCPRPVQRWTQCGLDASTLNVLQKCGYTTPFPIQAQAIPAIMSGRDVIACAKTGSGKTMAFVMPMIRHVLDQPPLVEGEGPIALIMAPTRELAIQIYNEVRKFCKSLRLRSVCCYGGASISEQIATLKRGAEIIVATPGRFIDMLCVNQGRVTNLKRVTYVVLDEADRMFDMGFEPQISAIVVNARPDRQTVLFSATFPKQIEGLAKKALKNPVEIVIGGRSVASNTVTQYIEVIQQNDKPRRLLQLLGEWYDKGNVLIFVDRKESVDILFRDLTESGYACLSLHGGMDQSDRDYTILDFKKQVKTIMIATSIAARGLDVKELICVINYTVPNHYEDYVHRVGRTGRAGTKGFSYTLITPEEDRFAGDMMKALEMSKQPVTTELKELVDGFKAKREAGTVKFSSNSGYASAKGFKFDEAESLLKSKEMERQKKSFGGNISDEEEEVFDVDAKRAELKAQQAKEAEQGGQAGAKPATGILAQIAAMKAAVQSNVQTDAEQIKALQAAKAKSAALALQMAMENRSLATAADSSHKAAEETHFQDEYEINDYPQQARWKITAKGSLNQMLEKIDVCVTTKGSYFPAGKPVSLGDRKLYVLIEGKSALDVQLAKNEIRRILEEAAINSKPDERDPTYNRYSVV